MRSLQMRRALFAVALSASLARPGLADEAEDTAAFKAWVDARAGSGAPVHWIAEGSVHAFPSGKKLFGMIGFDSSTVIWPDGEPNKVLHLTRKTFAYTHPETGEVLTEWEGQNVEPIAYPYQLITYRLEDGMIYGDVEQGVGAQVTTIKAEDGIDYQKLGDSYAYNAAVFLDMPLPGGARLEAWENYDFFVHPEGTVEEPHQLSWARYGDLPAFAGGGPGIMRLVSWRVERLDEFPPDLLKWAQSNAPMWLAPPMSIEEIRELQKE